MKDEFRVRWSRCFYVAIEYKNTLSNSHKNRTTKLPKYIIGIILGFGAQLKFNSQYLLATHNPVLFNDIN